MSPKTPSGQELQLLHALLCEPMSQFGVNGLGYSGTTL